MCNDNEGVNIHIEMVCNEAQRFAELLMESEWSEMAAGIFHSLETHETVSHNDDPE